jgi:hypothetical protein
VTRHETSGNDSEVGGWLLLLCRLLLVYQPLSLAFSASIALNSLPTRGPQVLIAVAVRVVAAGMAVAAGLALTNRAPGAVTLAKVALFVSAASDVFILTTPFAPNNRPPGDTPLYVVASLLFHGAWLAYLVRSKRVAGIYGGS